MSTEWYAIVFLALLCALPGCFYLGWWLAKKSDRGAVDRAERRVRAALIDAFTNPKTGEWK